MTQSSVTPVLLVALLALGVMAFAGLNGNTTRMVSTSTLSKATSNAVIQTPPVNLNDYYSQEQYEKCVLAREIEWLAQSQQMRTSPEFSAFKTKWQC